MMELHHSDSHLRAWPALLQSSQKCVYTQQRKLLKRYCFDYADSV